MYLINLDDVVTEHIQIQNSSVPIGWPSQFQPDITCCILCGNNLSSLTRVPGSDGIAIFSQKLGFFL